MTTRILHLFAIVPAFVAALSCGVRAQALDPRCVENGGNAVCTEPVVAPLTPASVVDSDMWTYGACDFDGATTQRSNAWCLARGGTLTANGCTGAEPLFDANLVGVSKKFEQIVNNACQVNASGGGWGQTIPYNILCWTGGPLMQNNKLVRDFMRLDFSGLKPGAAACDAAWTDIVYGGRWRAMACPAGYSTRKTATGDLECWKFLPECSARVGNPINLLDGCKLQREVDYRSRAPGGIEVERFYNSSGYFRFDAAPERASDVWRTTWDRRIVAARTTGAVLGYAQRADGTLQVFASTGRELFNADGGGSAVLERMTDATGVTAGWRLTTADRDVEAYDGAGRLQSITRRAGWTYALAYDPSGRLVSVTDRLGNIVTFTYDAAGRLNGFTAPGNRVHRYGYDDGGRLVTVTHPDGAVRTYHYENASFRQALTGITDENGARYATWSYDTQGRAITSTHAGGAGLVALYHGTYSGSTNEGSTTVVDAFGTSRSHYYQGAAGMLRVKRVSQPCPGCTQRSAAFGFDVNGNLASYTDFNGNVTTYTFDLARNLEISRTEASGTALARTIATQWHPVYRLPIRITAPSGVAGLARVTDFAYDAHGNLLQKTIRAGTLARQWTTTYDASGQVLSVDGPRADAPDVTTYAYYGTADPCVPCRGNVRTIANALGHITTFDDYDSDGQPLRSTDANGVVTTSTYDARGRLRTRTLDAGRASAETTAFDYDAAGQLVRVTAPDGAVLRYQYDDAHRLTEVSDLEGSVIQYTLDAMGNRIKEDVFDAADRSVKTRQRTYDALNRQNSEIGATGQTTTYGYDGNGNVTVSADPLARSTTLAYDALNRLSTSTDPVGGVARYAYDAADRLAMARDPINLATSYTYDGLGNLAQLASPDTGISTFVADARGNVIGATDARGATATYAYDALNRQRLATFAGGSVTLEYDDTATSGAFARGRLTRIADPSGATVYRHDALGRVLGKAQTVGTGASARTLGVGYQYAAGRLTGITYPSGRVVSYGFDAQGRIAAIAIAGQTILAGVGYFPFGAAKEWAWRNGQVYRRGFDADGRIASVTLGPDTVPYANEAWTFAYDGANRLAAATLPQGQTLAYAYDANGNRRQETRAGATIAYAYSGASNRLQALSGAAVKSYAYDAAGNLTGNGASSFAYDGRGRLMQAGGGHTYAINGLGQRVAKAGPSVATGTAYYMYDEQGRLIGEYDAAGVARQEFVYLAQTPVAIVRPNAGTGIDVLSIYTDHLDTPRIVANDANQVLWEWKTDGFGAGLPNENPSGLGAFSFNLRFPGQYYDAETGLHYNYFRHLDPQTGRYIESDPIGMFGGMNTYGYVGQDPLNGIDPYGLWKIYGNWCGPDWTGGFRKSWIDLADSERKAVKPPIDQLDGACKDHDLCYGQCGADYPCDPSGRSQCFRNCDLTLARRAFAIGGFWGTTIGAAIDRPGGRDPGPNAQCCSSDSRI